MSSFNDDSAFTQQDGMSFVDEVQRKSDFLLRNMQSECKKRYWNIGFRQTAFLQACSGMASALCLQTVTSHY